MFDCNYFTIANIVEYLYKKIENDEIVDYLTNMIAEKEYKSINNFLP